MTDATSTSSQVCRKNTGVTKRLRRWSRGHQLVVRAGGHIEAWQPLYKWACILTVNNPRPGLKKHNFPTTQRMTVQYVIYL